ncbi:ATP-binding protein [Pelagicoccus sp. SDUM812005]|uniref:PAS domain-containing hybrid sensor histidine kinase/response regulator n=1 Tax=Pelagicoccus sp. SDUM812005 TaxID=3041257 RepID=UPI00280FEEC1|nr:ATP-binding protein [Pelagicoccus sp. SDUM812005]MDQ8179225.1 ATP-binding protein [Pelagicoccus sp. SDUM812005]
MIKLPKGQAITQGNASSLGRSILVPVFATALLLFAGIVAVATYTSNQRSLELQKNEARSIAHAITYAVQTVPDLHQLNRFVTSLGGHSNIHSIHIVKDPQGTLVASTNLVAIGKSVSTFKTLTRHPLDQAILDLSPGVFYEDSQSQTLTFCDQVDLSRWESESLSTVYGRVLISLDHGAGQPLGATLVYLNTAAASASVLVLLVCVFILLKRKVLQPLQSIANGLDSHFGDGQPFRTPDLPDNEIGQLARHLENTFQTIIEQNRKAAELTRDLLFQKDTLDHHAIVSETDVRGRITYANRAFCEISGYSQDELIGQDHRILNSRLHPVEFWKHMYRQVDKRGYWHGEIRNRTKDGNFYWGNTTIAAFKNEKGEIERYVSIRTDITALKEAEFNMLKKNSEIEHALQLAQKAKFDAEKAARAKAQFLATMSHEIRTPMNGLIGVLHLLEEDLPSDKVELLQTAKNSADDLLVLINDILDFSKIEAGKMELESIEFDGMQLIESVCDLHATTAHNKQIDLAIHCAPGIQHKLTGDPVRIRQIVSNLIGNAIKFTEHGFVAVALEMTSHSYRISVTDTGVGLKQENAQEIFSSFTQENASTTRKFGGTGLGLSICKKLVELMGGSISVESQIGSGSTFSFEIPRSGPIAKSRFDKASLKGKNVLLVAPDSHTKQTAEIHLKHWGLETFTWSGGDAQLPRFDFVILDTQWGNRKETSWETIQPAIDLAENYSLIEINGVGADLTEAHAQQAHKRLSKPLSPRKLLEALDASPSCKTPRGKESSENKSYAHLRILIVDDNFTNRLIASKMMTQRHGIKPDTAASGTEALEKTQSDRYDLIFMDCMMPEMDGYETTKRIRAGESGPLNVEAPIIALTANAMTGDREKCESAGMNDYMAKPVDPRDLARMLESWSVKGRQAAPKPTGQKTLPLDMDKIRKVYRGNHSAIIEMLEIFDESIEDNLHLLGRALQFADTEEDVRFYAHRIRGSAAEMGASRLSSISQKMEEHCLENRLQAAESCFPAVQLAVKEVQDAIRNYKRENEAV